MCDLTQGTKHLSKRCLIIRVCRTSKKYVGKDGNLHPFHTVVRHLFLPHTLHSCRLGSNKPVYTWMKLFAVMTTCLIPSMNFAIGPPLPLGGIQQIFGGRGPWMWMLCWVLGSAGRQGPCLHGVHILMGGTSRKPNYCSKYQYIWCVVSWSGSRRSRDPRHCWAGPPEQWGREDGVRERSENPSWRKWYSSRDLKDK